MLKAFNQLRTWLLNDAVKRQISKPVNDGVSQNLPWSVLCLATGIGIYFSLPVEGSSSMAAIILVITLFIWVTTQNNNTFHQYISIALLVIIGYSAALYRTHASKTPLLTVQSKAYSFSMKVEDVSLIQNNRIRYSGETIYLSKISDSEKPKKIRFQMADQGPRFSYGDIICGRVRLKRPNGPLLPSGYDFGRALWFKQIGGTGYSVSPIKLCGASLGKTGRVKTTSPIKNLIATLREAIALRLNQNLNPRSLALARAFILGDKGRIEKQDLLAMRKAGLGHLLAISGLHMAVFAGTLFFIVRAGLALSPTLAEQKPIKKWAAVAAMMGGGLYFLISGQSIPTQRAFLMISIIFMAMLVERPALTLRNVVLAAMIILVLRPESLLSPGFQMSFAAVTALIVFYQWNLKQDHLLKLNDKFAHANWIKPIYYISGIWLTSLVATAATAPFAIYQFHQISYMGPIGNILAIPIFSFLIMPLAVASLCLMPLGLEAIPLKLFPYAIELLLATAHWTASFDPAIINIGTIETWAVILFTLAAMLAIFANSSIRLLSIPLLLISLWTAKPSEQPDIFVSEKGDVIALRDIDGKLYAPDGRKGRFTLQNWLQADGDPRHPVDMRAGANLSCDELACSGRAKNIKVTLIKDIAALEHECKTADIIIYKFEITRTCKSPMLILSRSQLKAGGTHAIYINGDKVRVERAYEARSKRIWGQGK